MTRVVQVSFIVALSLSLYAGFVVLHYQYGPHAAVGKYVSAIRNLYAPC